MIWPEQSQFISLPNHGAPSRAYRRTKSGPYIYSSPIRMFSGMSQLTLRPLQAHQSGGPSVGATTDAEAEGTEWERREWRVQKKVLTTGSIRSIDVRMNKGIQM
jgi:hypothetical protein